MPTNRSALNCNGQLCVSVSVGVYISLPPPPISLYLCVCVCVCVRVCGPFVCFRGEGGGVH